MTQQLPARSSTHMDWLGLCSVLRPRQHSIGYMRDGSTQMILVPSAHNTCSC